MQTGRKLHDKLYKYQKEGLAFLYSLHKNRKGGILADDMGLGKTVQILTFLSGMFDMDLIKTVLLVVPVSLISNWMEEVRKWTPGMHVKVFHTSSRSLEESLKTIQEKGDVLITTYQMLVNRLEMLSHHRSKDFIWDIVIFDEAHKLKKPSNKTTKAASVIPSKTRILLTGTPVQNNLQEMWALFSVACQGAILGSYKSFKKLYETPITRGRMKDASISEKKSDLVVWLYLSPLQERIYRDILSSEKIKNILLSSACPLTELTMLRASAIIQGYFLLMASLGKLAFLVALLEKLCSDGHRTLVFCRSCKMLNIIEKVLTARISFFTYRWDSQTDRAAQQAGINVSDQSDYSIMLLTTQVGGVGLNLTAANRVVIFEPSWNPATDAQAIDRVYRIGQEKNVIVYRLITCGTVEEKVFRRQVFKNSLIRQVTGDEMDPFRHFTHEQLKDVFTLEKTSSRSSDPHIVDVIRERYENDVKISSEMVEESSLKSHSVISKCRVNTTFTEPPNSSPNLHFFHVIESSKRDTKIGRGTDNSHLENVDRTPCTWFDSSTNILRNSAGLPYIGEIEGNSENISSVLEEKSHIQNVDSKPCSCFEGTLTEVLSSSSVLHYAGTKKQNSGDKKIRSIRPEKSFLQIVDSTPHNRSETTSTETQSNLPNLHSFQKKGGNSENEMKISNVTMEESDLQNIIAVHQLNCFDTASAEPLGKSLHPFLLM
uniref:DNA excision repair protein ERCC-6-like n=1 Tax=Erpetoichthys calabaricus TaxID=27687 RepID=A0A8C4XBN6_ERPCA